MLKAMDASLALWRGDYETFRRMEEARSAGYTAKFQKVVSAVCPADVDIACNELKNARTHLEYAIQEGGTLYVVEDARRMLAELARKEWMEVTMGKEQLKSKIEEQWAVYQALRAGNDGTVRYKEFQNGKWSTGM